MKTNIKTMKVFQISNNTRKRKTGFRKNPNHTKNCESCQKNHHF